MVKLLQGGILQDNYDTYMELMKHSHPGYTFESDEGMLDFEAKFANVSMYVPGLNNSRPMNMDETQVGFLPFCAVASSLMLSKMSVNIPKACDLFQPGVTARGLCYTFNSETMPEVFDRSVIPESWFKVSLFSRRDDGQF